MGCVSEVHEPFNLAVGLDGKYNFVTIPRPDGWQSRPSIRAFLEKILPLDRVALLVSGGASFEIVQKALSAGIPISNQLFSHQRSTFIPTLSA